MAIFLQLLRDRPTRLDILALFRFLAVVAIVIAIYSIIFHYIMEYEGRTYSWITGIYWTLTVMSTLGFGDITFESDLGRAFSGIVLLSGMIFLLILLPFTFIEFFYAPWMKAQEAARAPRKLPEKTTGHAVLTHFDAVTDTLITKLMQYKHEYVLLIDDLTEALRLHELGYRVMLGDLDDPETYRQARVEQAMFVAATGNDQTNTNVTFTVREISESVPIIAVANRHASIDILQLAGSSHVLELGKTMGQALSRQVTNNTSRAQVIGAFGALHIAEASARGTALVGKTVQASNIHEQAGAHVVGIWERGAFQQAQPETRITADTILILAGTETQLNAYNEHFCHNTLEDAPIVVIGGGRVGRAVGQTLAKKGLDYRIIEKNRERIPLTNANHYIAGDAAELEKLEAAGIRQAPAVIITTHDDDMNVYLTIYCRRLRPDAQIISRAVQDRNVSTLHRAGADFVLSYASTGANAILNLMRDDEIVMVDEALDIFEVPIPESLAGRPIDECNIRDKTGCIVVAMHDDHTPEIIRDQDQALLSSGRLILVGTPDAEERFLKLYK